MSPQSALLSVYDGQRCIGFILQRSKLGHEAFTADERSLGLFKTWDEAATAISEKVAAS
jgi:hypothetical protein